MFVNYVSHHILSLLVFFPIFGALCLFCIPEKVTTFFSGDKFLKNITFAIILLEFIFSLHLIVNFVPQSFDFQFASKASWLSLPGILYTVGIDGFSVYLVLLHHLDHLYYYLVS